jgi:hypothetical protein
MQDVVEPFKLTYALNSYQVDWLLYYAQQGLVAASVFTHRTELIFTEKETPLALPHLLCRLMQSLPKRAR